MKYFAIFCHCNHGGGGSGDSDEDLCGVQYAVCGGIGGTWILQLQPYISVSNFIHDCYLSSLFEDEVYMLLEVRREGCNLIFLMKRMQQMQTQVFLRFKTPSIF